MSSRPLRILGYGPYGMWRLHGMWEITLLQAARLRGAEIEYVMCDGVFPACDMFWESTCPRGPLSCNDCQASTSELARAMHMPYHWLGRYLVPADFREAQRWSASLDDREMPRATYGEWDVGEWVRSSVYSDQRTAELDFDVECEARSYRRYLNSGLLACLGISRLLDEVRPDLLFMLNGRQSSTRVALELARRRGIRVLCHERGRMQESIRLFENGNSLSMQPYREIWRQRGEIPLLHAELEALRTLLDERAQGRNHSLAPFSPPPTGSHDGVRRQLGLRPDRPTWVLFATSFHEEGASRGSAFTQQIDWIRRSVDFAARHPEIDLVLRPHPNTQEKTASGAVQPELRAFTELAGRLPANVVIVGADAPVSSYTLIELSSVVLTYVSTIGLECACAGKAVVTACESLVSELPFVWNVTREDRYEPLLERLLEIPVGHRDPGIMCLAHRFAHGYYMQFNLPLPLVRMPTPQTGELAYASLDDLLPGRVPELDRILRVMLEGEPVCPAPTPEERARSDADERRFFGIQPDSHICARVADG